MRIIGKHKFTYRKYAFISMFTVDSNYFQFFKSTIGTLRNEILLLISRESCSNGLQNECDCELYDTPCNRLLKVREKLYKGHSLKKCYHKKNYISHYIRGSIFKC